jgi:hypothetical protein
MSAAGHILTFVYGQSHPPRISRQIRYRSSQDPGGRADGFGQHPEPLAMIWVAIVVLSLAILLEADVAD